MDIEAAAPRLAQVAYAVAHWWQAATDGAQLLLSCVASFYLFWQQFYRVDSLCTVRFSNAFQYHQSSGVDGHRLVWSVAQSLQRPGPARIMETRQYTVRSISNKYLHM